MKPVAIVCTICLEPVGAPERYRTCHAHKVCFISKRCIDNMAASAEDMQKQLAALKSKDLVKYALLLAAMNAESKTRTPEQRGKAKELVIEFARSTVASAALVAIATFVTATRATAATTAASSTVATPPVSSVVVVTVVAVGVVGAACVTTATASAWKVFAVATVM